MVLAFLGWQGNNCLCQQVKVEAGIKVQQHNSYRTLSGVLDQLKQTDPSYLRQLLL